MAVSSRGVFYSTLSPKYLHSNSTSHTSPFSAIAELVDNAYDPDVKAKQIWIDKTVVNGQECLSFMDNGNGLTVETMQKMLSFGYSDKVATDGVKPIGHYGNGFKSGSMRLGKDAIVISKSESTSCVGMLSQSYLESINAEQIIIPIVCFEQTGPNKLVVPEEHKVSLDDILKYSPFNTQEELLTELKHIPPSWSSNQTGTRILIWNLRRRTSGELEFDFERDRYDFRLPSDVYEVTSNASSSSTTVLTYVPDSVYSLRAYCSILYLKPRMQIIIRGQNVKSQLISKSLASRRKDSYKPNFLKNKPIPITFGFNTQNKDQFGVMMYHKNRLIKAYERVGCQNKAGGVGARVIGIIECDFLEPTHNKQSFNDTENYRKTMNSLGVKLEEYWKEMRYIKMDQKSITPLGETMKPDQRWVQCDTCLKWRKLPDGIENSKLPDKWFCHMNPDPQFRSCDVEEEPEDSDHDEPSYSKTYKQQEKEDKKKQKLMEEERIAMLNRQTAALERQHKKLKRQLRQRTSLAPTTPCSTLNRDPLLRGAVSTPKIPLNAMQIAGTPSSGSPIITGVFSLAEVSSPSSKRTQPNTPHETPKRPRVDTFNQDKGSASVVEDKIDTDVSTNSTADPIQGRPLSEGDQSSIKAENFENFQNTTKGGVQTVYACTSTQTVQNQVTAAPRQFRQNIDDGARAVKTESSSANGQQSENGSLSLCDSGRKQQEELLERIRTTTQERDAFKEKVEQLTAQVQTLQKEVLDLSKTAAIKKYNHQACQTVETEDPEDRVDYKSLLLKANKEVDRLVKENKDLLAAAMESNSEDYAQSIDSLMRDLDQKTNEGDELRSQLEKMREEKTNLAKECEELRLSLQRQREHNEAVSTSAADTTRSILELRQNVGRILVTLVPGLDLSQVNFECSVIDEILEQYLCGQEDSI